MTIKRVKRAAELRGIRFDGKKTWRNNTVGYVYEVFPPGGRGFFQADTLEGMYRYIMEFPIVDDDYYDRHKNQIFWNDRR